MARYRGPSTKIARKFGEAIFGYDKAFEKRKYPPGQHGNSKRRRNKSDYALQLREKQKAKYTYGVLEKQFRRFFAIAVKTKGVTGEILLQLLESRLDNVVMRMGIAPTRRAARQFVGHKHIMVNGKVVNIPSYLVQPNDVISVREKSKDMDLIRSTISKRGKKFPWLDWNDDNMTGTFLSVPEREQIPEAINEQLIVELYSK